MVNIYIGNTKIDQFKDEAVSIKSSVLDVSDITKITGDYSKTFTVPASRTNNKFFKHWYNANIDNSFDSRTKIEGSIDIDGVPFKKGKFRLYKVDVKKGVPNSYTINFFGNTIDIKETVGKDKIKSLDLTAFNHRYNSSNVVTGMSTGLFNKNIVYTLQAKKRYFYNSNPSVIDLNENNVNIAKDGGGTGVIWNDLKPSIKIINIIEAIEAKYTVSNNYENPIVFSRDFFGTTEFSELYMWLNPSEEINTGGGTQLLDWTSGFDFINETTNIGTYPFVEPNTYWTLFTGIVASAGYENTPFRVVVYSDNEILVSYEAVVNSRNIEIVFTDDNNGLPRQIYYEVLSDSDFKYTAITQQRRSVFNGSVFIDDDFISNAAENIVESNVIISEQLPDIEIITFLKGLFNMFKLVVVPQDDGTLYINTLNSYYNQGNRIDISKYIDNEKIEVKRGELINEIDIKFIESETALANQFKLINNRSYGDSLVRLKDENGRLLDGNSLSLDLPFEQFVYERLTDSEDETQTNIQIATVTNSLGESVSASTNLHYISLRNSAGKPFKFIEDNGSTFDYVFGINTPTQSYGITSPLYSIIFEAEFSTWDGVKINNTLYKNHYENYLKSVFNVKSRIFKYKAILPINIITKLNLNDVLTIKENDYRVNNYTYNLLDGVTNFELVNGFNNVLGDGFLIPKEIPVSNDPTQLVYNVPNAKDYAIAIIDNGFGVNWLTVTAENNMFTYNIDISRQGTRNANVNFTLGLQTYSVKITQIGTFSITFDSNTIKSDDNKITFDNK